MSDINEFYYANLGFLLNYTGDYVQDEIESELYRVIMQSKGVVHYDRSKGGAFESLEQEVDSDVTILLFVMNIIQSVYQLNVDRNFDPYIVVGYEDIKTRRDEVSGAVIVDVAYKILQDLEKSGTITVGGLSL